MNRFIDYFEKVTLDDILGTIDKKRHRLTIEGFKQEKKFILDNIKSQRINKFNLTTFLSHREWEISQIHDSGKRCFGWRLADHVALCRAWELQDKNWEEEQ